MKYIKNNSIVYFHIRSYGQLWMNDTPLRMHDQEK